MSIIGRGAGPWFESESRKLLGCLNGERDENFLKIFYENVFCHDLRFQSF